MNSTTTSRMSRMVPAGRAARTTRTRHGLTDIRTRAYDPRCPAPDAPASSSPASICRRPRGGRPMPGGDAMSTQATADLLAEVQALIHEREREGVLGLAELIGPAEWADLVPQLEPNEVAVLIQWLPDEEIGEILEELPPIEAARILRTLSAPEASQLLGEMDPDDAADVVDVLPGRGGRGDPRPDEAGGRGRDPAAVRLRPRHGRRHHDARSTSRSRRTPPPPRPSPRSGASSTRPRRSTTSTSSTRSGTSSACCRCTACS